MNEKEIMEKLKGKVENYLREKYSSMSVTTVLEEIGMIMLFYEEIMEEEVALRQQKQPENWYPRDAPRELDGIKIKVKIRKEKK